MKELQSLSLEDFFEVVLTEFGRRRLAFLGFTIKHGPDGKIAPVILRADTDPDTPTVKIVETFLDFLKGIEADKKEKTDA